MNELLHEQMLKVMDDLDELFDRRYDTATDIPIWLRARLETVRKSYNEVNSPAVHECCADGDKTYTVSRKEQIMDERQ